MSGIASAASALGGIAHSEVPMLQTRGFDKNLGAAFAPGAGHGNGDDPHGDRTCILAPARHRSPSLGCRRRHRRA